MPSSQKDHLKYTITEWCKEPFTTLLETIFKNDNITNFIDIGANVGGVIESLNKLNYIKKLKNIVCFEPDNDNFNFLLNTCENIKKNNNIDIICHNIGIFYGKTQAQVCGTGDNNIGGYFIDDDNTNKERNYNIVRYNNKTFYLDVIEKYINFDIDIVKIDIEGSEINVLENSTILKNSKYIILEWHFETQKLYDFLKTNLENFEIIFDCKNSNYLLKNKNRL
jgi:FkbM family methyltransferase